MAYEYELYLEASTRSYQAYFKDATVYIGEILFCELEPNNQYSKYAVVVKNEDDRVTWPCWAFENLQAVFIRIKEI